METKTLNAPIRHPGETENLEREILFKMIKEMRTPITNINLAAEWIKEINGNGMHASMQSFLQTITRNVHRIDLLVRNILKGPVDQGEFAPVDICQSIEKALEIAKERIFVRSVCVKKEMQECPEIMGDDDLLCLAFLNIINTALEALEGQTHPILEVETYHSKKNIEILIRNNGAGKDQYLADKLLDKDLQHATSINELLIVRTADILVLHGGFINLFSIPGVGTSFIITLKKKSNSRNNIAG